MHPAEALPLVMLTSLGGRDAIRQHESNTAEFAAFLTKPIKPSQLYNSFATILGDMVEEVEMSESELAQFM